MRKNEEIPRAEKRRGAVRTLIEVSILLGVGVVAFLINGYVSAAVMVLVAAGVLGGVRVKSRRREALARQRRVIQDAVEDTSGVSVVAASNIHRG